MKPTAAEIQKEYTRGVRYKESLGRHGMFRQNEINERVYSGDQWHGAGCGEERPLVRQNVIRRIADYKMATVGADPITVTFSAQGIPDTPEMREALLNWRNGEDTVLADTGDELNRSAAILSDHFSYTAERLKFDDLKQRVMLDAYITGTGILYTYWDDRLKTGLFADHARKQPIKGDIVSEILHVDRVFLGDPTVEDLQEQPYLIIAQRKRTEALRQTARQYGGSRQDAIRPDSDDTASGLQKATVLTRLWKEWDEDGNCRVWGMQVCGNAVVRPKWCLGVRLYPLAMFRWSTRTKSGYGESEITHLIPNQIAINRMMTAGVWATMMNGMPIMVVNGDVVTQPITNDPGQIVSVYGSGEDVDRAIRYVEPPAYSSQFESGISMLISDTLSQSGANGVLLGDVNPNNASAILAVRESSSKPMQLIRNRFYSFCEDVARIWAEFFVCMYGRRPLRVRNAGGFRYCDFDGERCADMLFSVKVDVEESVARDHETTLQILGMLLEAGVINAEQYIGRLPEGTIPKQRRLLQELQEQAKTGETQKEEETA